MKLNPTTMINTSELVEQHQQHQQDETMKLDEETAEETSAKNLEALFTKMKDQEDFYKRLVEFHKHRNVNTAIHRLPTINGRLLDLRALYNRVVSAGGWERVCEKNKWDDLAAELEPSVFKACMNGAHALKMIYIRYLSLFEKFDQQTQYLSNASKNSLASLLDPLVNLNPTAMPNSSNSVMLNPTLTGVPASYNNLLELNGNDDPDLNRRKFSHLIDSTPMTYNYAQHANNTSFGSILNANLLSSPTSHHESTEHSSNHIVSSAFEPILLSLLCGLPNEVDFIFNTLVHLSCDDKNPFKIAECPRIVEAMLAHVGFFGASDKFTLRRLYESSWNAREIDVDDLEDVENIDKSRLIERYAKKDYSDLVDDYMKGLKRMKRRSFVMFWKNGIQMPDDTNNGDQKYNLNSLLSSIMPKLADNSSLSDADLNDDLLNMFEGELTKSIEYRRLEQLMIVLNNLSFDEMNAEFMANRSGTLFEFLILSAFFSSREPYVNLRRHSLDILTNVAKKLKLKRLGSAHRALLIGTLHHLIVNDHQDRLDTIRGLEVLSKLCGRDLGEDELSSNDKTLTRYDLLNSVLTRMVHLLTSQDLLIVLHALECLYTMTLCTKELTASNIEQLVPILVNFLTLDMSHFGAQAIDTPVATTAVAIPSTPSAPILIAPQQSQQQPKVVQASVINGKAVIKTVASPAAPSPAAKPANTASSLLHQTLQQQHALNVSTNQSPASSASSPGSGLIKINTTGMPAINATGKTGEDESAKNTLTTWLTMSFQPDKNSEISKTQLYAHYQHIAKIKGWTVLTIPTFFEILNSTFPNIRYNEETNKLMGIKLDPQTSSSSKSKNDTKETKEKQPTSAKPAPGVVVVVGAGSETAPKPPAVTAVAKKEDSTALSSLLSPPPTVSVSVYNQASPMTMPLLTPPSPPPPKTIAPVTTNTTEQTDNSDKQQTPSETVVKEKDNKPIVNGDDKLEQSSNTATNNALNPTISEILNQNEDSTSSMSSSSSTMSSATSSSSSSSTSSSSTPSNAENASKRKADEITKESNPEQAPKAPETSKQEAETTDNDSTAKKQKPEEPNFVNKGDYMCEWNGCDKMFPTSKAVYNHVCKYHLMSFWNTNNQPDANKQQNNGYLCLWSNGCDQIKRQKWSLVNHIMERHCNENAMKTVIICRQRGITPIITHPAPYLNYSSEAAQLAIQRNQKMRRDDFFSPEEGPITKSIHLLAALSLRNLAKSSPSARKVIKNYENELANIAFDLLEASNALTNCLWYLYN